MILGKLTILTMDDDKHIYEDAYLRIEQGEIVEIGSMASLKEEYISMEGKLCLPGLINMHTHLGLWAFRSLAEDMPDRLRKFLLPNERRYMHSDLLFHSTRLAAYESLANGVTSLVDMYYYPRTVWEALKPLGMRVWVGQTILENSQIDFSGDEKAFQKRILSDIQFFEKKDKFTYFLAPHAPYSISKSFLLWVQKMSEKYGLLKMMHVSEMDFEMDMFQALSPIAYLDALSLLDERFLAVHCIHTSEQDRLLLSERDVKVVHCPAANMKAGKGIANIASMLEQGVDVSLGTDGPISGNTLDLFEKMRLTAYAQKTLHHKRDLLPSQEILAMVTSSAAKALGRDDLGSIELGKKADLTFLSLEDLNMQPIYDYYAAVVYAAQSHNVTDVMVDGVFLYRNRAYENTENLDESLKALKSLKIKRD